MPQYFDKGNRVREDDCANKAQEKGNQDVFQYHTFNMFQTNQSEQGACAQAAKELEEFYTGNFMNIRNGFGVTSSCVIDEDNKIRRNTLTHDKGPTQLFHRTFQAVPNFGHGSVKPDIESVIQQGENTYNAHECESVGAEFMPMIDCLRNDVQNSEHIIPPWTRGGDHTRDTLKQKEFLEKNGYDFDGQAWTKKQCGRA